VKTGADLVAWAKPHAERNERYVLGAWAPKWDKNYRGPWDCAEFVSAGVYQTYGLLLGCANNYGSVRDPEGTDAYTGFWGRDADKAVVQTIAIAKGIWVPGAILLRRGKVGHIVICMGDGAHTIEAANHKAGVIIGKVEGRRWDDAILVPGVDYDLSSSELDRPKVTTLRLTNPYMVRQKVAIVQKALIRLGAKLRDDGIYGPQTAAAVRQFQADAGLVPDGEVGDITLAKLGVG
jgi:N-acetylmuramoyl-L-alanine amidase